MSEDELRQLWCLLDSNNPKETPFSVNTKLSWNMYELTEAIQGKKDVLRDFNPSDITLWKVEKLIQVSPIDSFRKRLPISLSDFCSALDDPALEVSEIFPEDLVQDPLHIIVGQPDKPPYKKRRVGPAPAGDQSEETLDRYRNFRNYYWGENRIKHETKGGQTYSLLDLTLPAADLPELNYRSVKYLIIRNEYTLAYDAIVKAIAEMELGTRVVFIFTGQPGTGKTLFLFELLVLGLQHKQTVALQTDVDDFFLFNEDGVSKHGKNDTDAIPEGAWTLSDSESVGPCSPCSAFRYSKGHLIHTSSPASGLWKKWSEQYGATEYVMDIWSMAEFCTLLTVSDFDIQAGKKLFLKYGSNIRSIIDILKRPQCEVAYIQDVEHGAADIAREFPTIFHDLERLNFMSKLSSEIFTVRPNNLEERLGVLTIPTAHLFKTLAMAVSRQALAQQHLICATLTAHPSLGTAAGWWFENYAHVMLSDPTRKPIPTHTRGTSNSSSKAMLSGSTYLDSLMGSTIGSQISSASAVHGPSGSTMGGVDSSPGHSETINFTSPTNAVVLPRRSPRNQK